VDPKISAPNRHLRGELLEVSCLTSGNVQKAEVKCGPSRRAVGPGSSCNVALMLLFFRGRLKWRDPQS